MSKGKKFTYAVVQNENDWSAGIVRQASRAKTIISKTQDGFASEAEAIAWGEEELKNFTKNLAERNKRQTEQRNR